jgi:hypothetical protein
MTTTNQSVNAEEFGTFLSDLYGLKITAAEEAGLTCDKFGCLATYVDSEGNEKGRILCDLQGAAMLGAALTQVPMGAVEDAVSAGELPDNLSENVREVLNISVNVFPSHENQRLVLKDVSTEASELPPVADAVPLKLEIQRYGACKVFIFCD